jgi:hypothetical protein
MGFGPKIDFSGVSPAIENKFLDGRKKRELAAARAGIENQKKLNAEARKEHKSIDGLGAPTAYIDNYVYHHWANREGGREVWQDKQHLRYMKEAGMEFPKAKGTRLQVQGVDIPGSTRQPGKSFFKSYGP